MMDRTTRPLVIVAAFAGSLVVGLVLMLWALGGLRTVAAPAAIGGPFQLTDQAGQIVTEKSLQGRPTLIFFGFTHCPDVCPTSLFEISEVLRAMGNDADRVNAYFISVDPERDTDAAMKDYLSSFDPHLKGLTGEPDAVAKVISGFRVYARKVPPQGRRLHHGPYRPDLSDGSRRPLCLAVQPQADARGSRGRSEALPLTDALRVPQTAFASPAGWSIRPSTPEKPSVMQSQTGSSFNERFRRTIRATLDATGLSLGAVLAVVLSGCAVQAQTLPKPGTEAAPQAVPGFWDPRRRPERPDLSRLTVIRFLTETDYPPFNFTGPDGNPAGFNVDLARLLCDEIKVSCTIQMRRFETLLDAITSNRGDAIIASLAVTPQLRAPRRFHRSVLPGAGAVRVAARRRDAGGSP